MRFGDALQSTAPWLVGSRHQIMYFVLCGKWCTESWMRHPMAERVPVLNGPRRLMLYEYEVRSTK